MGIPFSVRVWRAFRRFSGGGALGSRTLAKLSSSVVIVMATTVGIFVRMSKSLVTKSDFVII